MVIRSLQNRIGNYLGPYISLITTAAGRQGAFVAVQAPEPTEGLGLHVASDRFLEFKALGLRVFVKGTIRVPVRDLYGFRGLGYRRYRV